MFRDKQGNANSFFFLTNYGSEHDPILLLTSILSFEHRMLTQHWSASLAWTSLDLLVHLDPNAVLLPTLAFLPAGLSFRALLCLLGACYPVTNSLA